MLLDNRIQQLTEYFRSKAPYFPKYHIEKSSVVLSNSGQTETTYYATCLLRYKQQGVWYTRHHLCWSLSSVEDVTKELIAQVYLDILFGKPINMKDTEGNLLNRKDKLQVAESERLLNVKEPEETTGSADDSIIAKQAKEIDHLKTTLKEYEKSVRAVRGLIYSIGAPLNDNILGYTDEQLVVFARIDRVLPHPSIDEDS